MIAIYELRKDNVGQTNRTDAQIVTNFMESDEDYFKDDSLKQFGGSVMNCEDVGIFTDNESKVIISVCCDRETIRRPTRIQFTGLEEEVLGVKNILDPKLNKEGYRLS